MSNSYLVLGETTCSKLPNSFPDRYSSGLWTEFRGTWEDDFSLSKRSNYFLCTLTLFEISLLRTSSSKKIKRELGKFQNKSDEEGSSLGAHGGYEYGYFLTLTTLLFPITSTKQYPELKSHCLTYTCLCIVQFNHTLV